MTIRNRILQSRWTIDYYITISDNRCEYSNHNTGFFLSDYDEYEKDKILDKELEDEYKYIKNGCKCIALNFN